MTDELMSQVEETHPDYDRYVADWEMIRDAYEGERRVKAKETVYLPSTSGQQSKGMEEDDPGRKQYRAYLTRAVFPDVFPQAVSSLCGLIHGKQPQTDLPNSLQPMLSSMTPTGDDFEALSRRVTCEVLTTGRYGLLVDPADGDINVLPKIVGYSAESIRNWSTIRTSDAEDGEEKLDLLVLDESRFERSGFHWHWRKRYRVCELVDGVYQTWAIEEIPTDDGQPVFSGGPATAIRPNVGGRTLDFIPFVFANPMDHAVKPDRPPLVSLARLAYVLYRGEADYRQNLFMQAQDTLVLVGATPPEEGEAPLMLGAGSTINVDLGGDAKFIGVSSTGLPEQRQSLENDYGRAGELGAQLLRTDGSSAWSGEALRLRLSAQTATIATVSRTSAGALNQALLWAGQWTGTQTADVVVKPNLDFSKYDLEAAARAMRDLMTAKQLGLQISDESIHEIMRESELTAMKFAQELEAMKNDPPRPVQQPSGALTAAGQSGADETGN